MRVASKIAAGSIVLLVLLIGVIAYHVSLVRRIVEAGTDLSANQHRAADISLRQNRLLRQVTDHARKLLAISDPAYAAGLGELRRSFDQGLAELEGLDLSDAESREVERLGVLWRELCSLLLPTPGADSGPEPWQRPENQQKVEPLFDELQAQADRVYDRTLEAVAARIERSQRRRQEAERISWAVLGLAALFIALIVYLTVRSINEPLRQLTEGTRAVAEGRFSYQLDASRNDEFSRLAAAFNTMVQRLSKLDQLKKDFVAHVSHELKNPLVAMHETNQLLLEEIPGPLTAQQRRLLELNAQSGRRLSSMLSNLLDLSSLEAGAMAYEFRIADVTELVRYVAQEFAARARERSLALALELHPAAGVEVLGDPDRLIQVLENLVENAVKYTPTGGSVEIGVRIPEAPPPDLAPEERRRFDRFASRGLVLLTVSDDGPGVADAAKEAIFRKFQQLESGHRASGVGLGLAICREIVEAHHGSVWVADRPGGGSRFSVLLPAAPARVGAGGDSAEWEVLT